MFNFISGITIIAGIIILFAFILLAGVVASEIIIRYEIEKSNKNISKEIDELLTMVNDR